jgi:hypothetical protein
LPVAVAAEDAIASLGFSAALAGEAFETLVVRVFMGLYLSSLQATTAAIISPASLKDPSCFSQKTDHAIEAQLLQALAPNRAAFFSPQ